MKSRLTVLPLLFTFVFAPIGVKAEPNWPRWRGPHQNGHTTEKGIPVEWSAENVLWRAPLPGRGQSSPILWENRIFLTTALDGGQKRVVFCVDRNSGKTLWEETVPWSGEPEPLHKMNSHATPSCATDGEVVVAFFGRAGLHCYTVEGKRLWSADLGPFISPWGVAGCPIILGDMVVQNCDADEGACLVALDKRTGKILWQTPRPLHRGWSTPILVDSGSRTELVLNGHAGMAAYDPETGEPLWSVKADRGRGTPTVTPAGDLLVAVCGLSGDMYAVRPGGSGEMSSQRAWHVPRRGGRDLPSPIVIGDYLLVANMGGVLSCYDAQTGELHYQGRLGGNYSASPIAAGGLAYFLSESGETVVVEPGEELKIVARNSLDPPEDESFRASLTPSRGQLFVRSDRALYCVGK